MNIHICTLDVIFTPLAHAQQGLSNCVDVCASVCGKKIENTNNQLKYAVNHSEKGTTCITTFELFFDGHSADSAIYNLLELQIQ